MTPTRLAAAIVAGLVMSTETSDDEPLRSDPRRLAASAPCVAPPRSRSVLRAAWQPPRLPPERERAIAERARQEVDLAVSYDARYWRLPSYPNGDGPSDRGACSDLVIRALRAAGIDLQLRVHEDVVTAPAAYASVQAGDANVDHRRVPTLAVYFARNTIALGTDVRDTATFRPGDVLFYAWAPCRPRPGGQCLPAHIALVSDRIGPRGLPLVLQNGGPRATEGDVLDHPTLIGHYRLTWMSR